MNHPPDGHVTNQPTLSVSGTVFDSSPVTVNANGVPLPVDEAGAFSAQITLAEGANVVTVTATDAAENASAVVRIVTLDTQPPAIAWAEPADGATITTEAVTVSGTITDATAVTLSANGSPITVAGDGSFSGEVPLDLGPNTITLVATDAATNSSTEVRTVTRQAAGPPDPATVASTVNPAEATLLQEATAFLYAGDNPTQTGVADGTISLVRAAVIRGRVLNRALEPLTGVAVTIQGHPELGFTETRSDGRYDMAVNGGGLLILDFQKGGYLPAQRQIDAPWQDYRLVDDVILLQPDTVVTVVDLTSAEIQVARGSVATDADGPRQATVLFEPGTEATLVHPDGTTDTLASLSIRVTEFTVGEEGFAAMPAELPPASQYTYAVQITADEQLAAGPGAVINFNQPVPLYVENFIDIPVGTPVPVGSYDPADTRWEPEPNGVVLSIVGTDAEGRTLLDINGDGVADSDSALAFYGIDPVERRRLADTYAPGVELWRAQPLSTYPYDLNLGYVLIGTAPEAEVESGACGSKGADVLTCSLQAQTAFQSVGIVGSPFTLNYASDRTQGNAAERQIEIELIGDSVPAELRRVDLEIDIAGVRFTGSFAPTPNLSHSFAWDGKDAYGRTLQSSQPAIVRVGYVYPVLYSVPRNIAQSFGLPCSAVSVSACVVEADVQSPPRFERTIWQETRVALGGFDAAGAGLGGFTFDVQHAYDPIGGQFYGGDGTRRVAGTLPDQLTRFAGTGAPGLPIENVLATLSPLRPGGLAIAPDGGVYVSDWERHRIRKVSPDGIITTVAGTGTSGFTGDGGLAIQARIRSPMDLALGPDGSLYFYDGGNLRIRRIGPDGIITTIAGDGTFGFTGDNGPSTGARFNGVEGLATAPDGSLYIVDSGSNRIRRIGPDGIITTVAGSADVCFFPGVSPWPPPSPSLYRDICGEGIPATEAALRLPRGIAIGPDGSVYFGQTAGGRIDARIRRIDPSGIIHTVAGKDHGSPPQPPDIGDGLHALQARLGSIQALAVGPDGTVYISDTGDEVMSGGVPIPGTGLYRVRRIRPDGIIHTIIADGVRGTRGDGGPAPAARIERGRAVGLIPDGSLLLADELKVRKVSAVLPGVAVGTTVIASEDGSELYVFTPAGRILLTLDAVTRDTIYNFAYNENRQLVSITDAFGQVTRLERDDTGLATAVVAPASRATTLTLTDSVIEVTGPDGLPLSFVFDSNGLLLKRTDQGGNETRYEYHLNGGLAHTTDADGGSRSVSVTPLPTGSRATLTTQAGVLATLQSEVNSSGTQWTIATIGGGLPSQITESQDGAATVLHPDGTFTTIQERADPVHGIQAPLADATVTTPSGLTFTSRNAAVVVLDGTGVPVARTDSVIVNGRATVTHYDHGARLTTITSAAGRRRLIQLNEHSLGVHDSVPGTAAWKAVYDSAGRLVSRRQGGRTWQYSYDGLGRLESRRDPLGREYQFQYDFGDRPIRKIEPTGDTTSVSYDALGQPNTVTPPSGSIHRFTYSNTGLLESYEPPAVGDGAPPLRFEYDADGRLTGLLRQSGDTLEVTYDSIGRPAIVLSNQGTSTFSYDTVTGQLHEITSSAGTVIRYTYDGDVATRVDWSGVISGSVGMSYDNEFRPSAESVNGSDTVTFAYDPDGLLIRAGALTLEHDSISGFLQAAMIGDVSGSYAHDQFGALAAIAAGFQGSTVFETHYSRDSLGRIETITETVAGQNTTWAFNYDLGGRLATVSRNGSVESSYEYDGNGNRIRAVGVSGVVDAGYDAQDRLLTYGSTSYSYTADGYLILRIVGTDTTEYSYSARGDLLAVRLSADSMIEYVVDGFGRRVGKKVNGVLVRGWLYGEDLTPIAELNGQGEVVSRFVFGERNNVPSYMIKNGQTCRLVTDHRGSVRLAIDVHTGDVLQQVEYDPFGRVTVNTNPGFQPFGFAGGLYDEQTGLVRFGARDYDPDVGRWTAKDPLLFAGRDVNLYAYVGNDPINYVDPTGLTSLVEQSYVSSLYGRLTFMVAKVSVRIPFVAKMLAVGSVGMKVMIRARQVLSSAQFARIQQAAARGVHAAEHFADDLITFEPTLPYEGMTFAGRGFHLGSRAFASSAQLVRTILHELYRLATSNVIGQVASQPAATAETQATARMGTCLYSCGNSLKVGLKEEGDGPALGEVLVQSVTQPRERGKEETSPWRSVSKSSRPGKRR